MNLNSDNNYNFLSTIPTDSYVPTSPYTQFNITVTLTMMTKNSLSGYLSNSNTLIFLSLNSQSLLSKFDGIKQLFYAPSLHTEFN